MNMNICLAASAGGHLTQLLQIAKSWKGYPVCFVTTNRAVEGELTQYGPVFIVNECNRNQPLKLIRTLLKCMTVIRHRRPDVVISTGAAPGLLMCAVGKMVGAKVVWLDSITNVERLSLSGRLVRPFADLVLTQWPELAANDDSIKYVGCVV
jgi:UDP-N-acetylglucosamine:LPS N-acetylglucosamine transferase